MLFNFCDRAFRFINAAEHREKIVLELQIKDDINLFHSIWVMGMVPNLAEGGIDKTPKNARIPDNFSYILSLYDSLP